MIDEEAVEIDYARVVAGFRPWCPVCNLRSPAGIARCLTCGLRLYPTTNELARIRLEEA